MTSVCGLLLKLNEPSIFFEACLCSPHLCEGTLQFVQLYDNPFLAILVLSPSQEGLGSYLHLNGILFLGYVMNLQHVSHLQCIAYIVSQTIAVNDIHEWIKIL